MIANPKKLFGDRDEMYNLNLITVRVDYQPILLMLLKKKSNDTVDLPQEKESGKK